MKNKRNVIFLVAVIVLLIVMTRYFVPKWVSAADNIKIGAVLPLSGDVAVYGLNTQKGIDIAVEHINENGGIAGRKLQILYEDSKADPITGVSGTNKLISTNNIDVIIDNSVSTVALAMVPVASASEVLVLSTGSTSPKLSGISDYFCRIWNSDAFEGSLSAEFAIKSLKADSVAILYLNNDYGIGLKDVFKRRFLELGGDYIDVFAYDSDNMNLNSLISQAKEFEVVYIVGYTNENTAILKKLKEFRYKGSILGTVTMEDPKIIELVGNASEGVIYPYPALPDSTKENVNLFRELFLEKYDEAPGITADVGFDAILVISQAYSILNDNPEQSLVTIMRDSVSIYGASGFINFDDYGDVSKPMTFKTIRKGTFTDYE